MHRNWETCLSFNQESKICNNHYNYFLFSYIFLKMNCFFSALFTTSLYCITICFIELTYYALVIEFRIYHKQKDLVMNRGKN